MNKKTVLRRSICAALAAAFALSAGTTAFAETPPRAGDVLRDTQQTERKLPERKAPNVTVEEKVKPPLAVDQSLKVFVKSYRITGQDVIPEEQLTGLLTGYVNKELNFTALQQARDTITKHLQKKGYFVAQAYLPQQDVNEGAVEITVLIGRYGNMTIKNQTRVSDAAVRAQLRSLKPGAYIHTAQMERAALLASDLMGVTVKATLAPGKNPGTADVIVEVTPKGKDLQGMLSFDNYGSRLTGYNKGTLHLSYNNPFRSGDKLSGTFSETNNAQNTGDLTYQIPIAEGSSLTLRYAKVKYEFTLDGSAYSGTAYTKHADWTYALKRSRAANLYAQVGYDHKTMTDLGPQNDSALSRMVSFGLSGDSSDELWGGGANAYSLTYYSGSLSSETPPSGSWSKYTYSYLRQQTLNDRLSLMLSLSGQASSDNLDGSERFSLGGPYGVRAYPVSEGSGYKGYLTTAELRYTVPAAQKGALWQFSAFYDRGVSTEKNYEGTADRHTVSGIGLGVQYAKPGDYALKVTYAQRIGNRQPKADEQFGSSRLWLQAVKYF